MSDALRQLFAARLSEARVAAGLSQRALGEAMGLGKQTGSTRVNRYERLGSSVRLDGLAALADTLGIPAAALLAETPSLASLIGLLAQAPPEIQDRWLALVTASSKEPRLLAALERLVNDRGDSAE